MTGACTRCGSELAPGLLACPGCRRLVHAEELAALNTAAEQAHAADGKLEALTKWRRALELLPPGSRQHEILVARVAELAATVDEPQKPATTPTGRWRWLGWLGPIALLLVTKGKFLLLGLTKTGTLLTMLASMGLYWAAWRWQFALGLVASIYVHEMGHVAALRRYGIAATAPMFVPGLGAFIRAKQYPTSAYEDARVGLAGPIWGTGAALLCYALAHLQGGGAFAALAHAGAILNLFNLIPLGSLDGGRGFRALSQADRLVTTVVIGALWLGTSEGMLLLVAAGGLLRSLGSGAPRSSDSGILLRFLALVVILSGLSLDVSSRWPSIHGVK